MEDKRFWGKENCMTTQACSVAEEIVAKVASAAFAENSVITFSQPIGQRQRLLLAMTPVIKEVSVQRQDSAMPVCHVH